MTTTTEKLPPLKRSLGVRSGPQWAQRFKGSNNIKDLAPAFRKAVEAFIDAMTEAGIKVRISATYRPIPRNRYVNFMERNGQG